MNALDGRRRLELGNVEIVHEGETLIIRRIVDTVKFRKIAANVLAHIPSRRKVRASCTS